MSVHITSWVLRNSPAKGADRLMLVVLADIANHDGFCWPGMELLREFCNLADRTSVERTLDRLVAGGMIVAEAREIVGRGHKKGYRVVIPADQLAVILGKNAASERPLQKGGKRPLPRREKAAPTQLHLRKEPLGTVTEEPTTPLTPRSGGNAFEPSIARQTETADEVERRIFAEHGVRLPRKVLRAIRHRIRVGETVEALVADYAPLPTDWTPPGVEPTARDRWRPVLDHLRGLCSAESFATWISPLRPVRCIGDRGLMIASPSRPFDEEVRKLRGAVIETAGSALGVRLTWWAPAKELAA